MSSIQQSGPDLRNRIGGVRGHKPFYAWLCKAAAAFLPIDDDPVAALMLDGTVDVEAISLRLPRLLEAIASGHPLPAHGVDAVCQYCEARGLCRKGAWDE